MNEEGKQTLDQTARFVTVIFPSVWDICCSPPFVRISLTSSGPRSCRTDCILNIAES